MQFTSLKIVMCMSQFIKFPVRCQNYFFGQCCFSLLYDFLIHKLHSVGNVYLLNHFYE